MSKTLTISIAAYNIEQYIHKVMQSLINTNCMQDLEILIVDDGSKDNTANIALEYQAKYPESVKLIKKQNGGHGSTINKGIEVATGRYFRALDGDDWVNSDNLYELVECLKTIDADMVVSDFDRCYSDGRITTESFTQLEHLQLYSADEALQKATWMCYHTIIYKTNILKENNIRLHEHCFYVDEEYNLFPIPYIASVFYFAKPIYCYRLGIDGQSVSPESRKKHIDHGYTVADSILNLCNGINELSNAKKQYIYFGVADHCIWHIQSILLFKASYKRQKEIKEFDERIKKTSPEVYAQMVDQEKGSRIIKLLRSTNYYGYWVAKAYKTIYH